MHRFAGKKITGEVNKELHRFTSTTASELSVWSGHVQSLADIHHPPPCSSCKLFFFISWADNMCGREEQKTVELPGHAHLTERMEFSNEEEKKTCTFKWQWYRFALPLLRHALQNQCVEAKVKDKQFIHRDLPDLIIQCVLTTCAEVESRSSTSFNLTSVFWSWGIKRCFKKDIIDDSQQKRKKSHDHWGIFDVVNQLLFASVSRRRFELKSTFLL